MITIRNIINHATKQFTQSDTPRLDAQVLLGHILGVNRAYLLAHDDEMLADAQQQQVEAYIKRHAQGEPIAYILGTKGFYDLEFRVTPDVLIPRPETELLLEEALRLMEGNPTCSAADIGTGSGALAVTFAIHMPKSQVYAIDVSAAALAIAKSNADINQASVQFFEGNLAQPLIDQHIKLDLLMANLPYIRHDEMSSLAVSQHESHLALDGGDDGLDLIRDLLPQIPLVCNIGAMVLLEIGAEQGNALQSLVADQLGVNCDILKDYAGHDRLGRFQI